MQKSTNYLTIHELDFLSSAEYPLLKQRIVNKIIAKLEEMGSDFKAKLSLNEWYNNNDCKITRGENYKGMPYVVMDYPKMQQGQFDLLCRTICWWGNYTSFNCFIRVSEIEKVNWDALKKIPDLRILTSEHLWENDILGMDYSDVSLWDIHNPTHSEYYRFAKTIPFNTNLIDCLEAVDFYKSVLNCFQKKKGAI